MSQTLAERITRKIAGGKPDPAKPAEAPVEVPPLVKAEAELSDARERLAAAHKAHEAAKAAAAAGNPASHRKTRLELDAAQAEHETAAEIYELAKATEAARAAAAKKADTLAAIEKLQQARYRTAVELDALVTKLGALYAERRRQDVHLAELLPGSYEMRHALGSNLEVKFREQLAAFSIPGGQATLRGKYETCAELARETGARALAVAKGSPKATPGA